MRRAVLLVVAAAIAGLAFSCTGTDVTLATLPGDDAAGPPPAPRCASNYDCEAGTYCEKPSCDSPSGTCELFPAECPNEEQPVCGCDNVTYFDHCTRQLSGVASETMGPCAGFTCGGPSSKPCSGDAVCAQLLGMGPDQCSPTPEGHCWVLPAQCPPASEAMNLWDSCVPGGQHCLDTCDALRAGGSYTRAVMCP